MSRIDDNSDNQRIREMQEAELRNRVDREKKDGEIRVNKAFSEVMREKAQQSKDKQQGAKDQGKKGAELKKQGEGAAKNLQSRLPARPGQELSRRAALSQALSSSLAKSRAAEGDQARSTESAKMEEQVQRADDDKERVEKGQREEAEKETARAEEREGEVKRTKKEEASRGDGPVDERRERRDGSKHRREDEARPEVVAAPAKAQGSSAPRISQELIDRIVNAIHTAHTADGRTEMHIDLKGSVLEGIRLKVSVKGGKVSCVFEGCDKETGRLLESTKGALMRGLERRGMSLVSLVAR